MKQNRRTRPAPVAEINIVPYVDVMLVLLVIFMITAPILTQGVQVELPQAQSETIQTDGVEPIIVSVDKEGQYFLNKSSKPEQPLSAKDLMIRVAAELRLEAENKRSPKVLVKGDQGVPYGKVITAMSRLKQAGANHVGLMTDNGEG